MADNLEKYRQKRDFKITAEPEGLVSKTAGHRYLIQKHAATRLHYDFRLELDGTLKSWAVTKGPSLDPADRRLAVEVEDHPVSYGKFEGTIPKGQYGGGTVMLWDEGTWEPIGDPHEGLKKGDFKFILHGGRLQGSWVLVRMKPRQQDRGRNNWLLIKHDDGYAREGDHDQLLIDNGTSIVSGRTMEDIAAGEGGGKVWKSNRAEKAAAPKKSSETPTLTFIEPELATLADAIPTGRDWLHEVKFDGYRTFAYIEGGSVRMLTRKGLDWTPKFQALADRLEGLSVKSAIIDGEIVALNAHGRSSFTELKNTLSTGRSADLQYYVFDLLYLDGEDLRSLPLLERKARLADLLKDKDFEGRINFSDHFFEADTGFLNKICDMEMEGLICKRADAPYASGRAKSWLKVKCHKRQEFVIGGFSEPTHAGRGIGAILLGYYEEEKFIYAGKCGTGFDRETSVALRRALEAIESGKSQYDDKLPADARRGAHYVTPKLVCEVEFTEWTDDGRLRHPSFQGLREDKPANEVGRDRALHVTKALMEAEPPPVEKPSEAPRLKKGDGEVAGIRISHPDRVIFPALGVTKLQLAAYYDSVAELMLPYIVNRPISMLRCPEGLSDTCFFQRHIGKGEMKHIYDTGVKVKGRDEDYIMIRDREGLITMVQWGVIEIHPWGAWAAEPDKPNQIIFDLDPDPETPWENVIEGVREVKARLDEFGLTAFLKTTGGKGLHVVVPLTPKHSWATVKPFTRAIAQSMAHDHPDRYIAVASKAARKGKIFVDYLRNDLTATAVAPYAVRAREGAGVATPLFWDELSVKLRPSDYNIGTIAERLAQLKSDPWAGFLTTGQTIDETILTALKIDIT